MGRLHPDGADDETQHGETGPGTIGGHPEGAGQPPQEAATSADPAAALTERRRQALAKARSTQPAPKESWRKRTATGAVLTGFALGLREALEAEPQKTAIVMEASGEPPTDLPVDAEVDQIRAADNVVRIRPWLLPGGEEADPVAPGDPGTAT